jgi:cytochrome c oxidase cbb3-type subunit 3/ubiquinol-cytochrome c reductase cytochrome c subunit
MKAKHILSCLTLAVFSWLATGCLTAPGKPAPSADALRPEQILDFPTLYRQNCAACHGEQGRQGAAVSLANPAYLAFAGADTITRITANGVPHTLMPAFSKQTGGTLTDQQITALVQGMVQAWGDPRVALEQNAPPYATSLVGDPAHGQRTFQSNCARCHGADGTGVASLHTGSLVDPAYLALVSDQSLRTVIVAGLPDDKMPDWRFDAVGPTARPMTDQEITDVVAWLAAHRTSAPGQPYPQHP